MNRFVRKIKCVAALVVAVVAVQFARAADDDFSLKRDTPEDATSYSTVTLSGYTGETTENVLAPLRIPSAVAAQIAEGATDLHIFDNATKAELTYDVDTWNPSGESVIWVKFPTFAAGTHTLTLVWGGETNEDNVREDVWTDYTGVWHLNEAEGTKTSVNVIPDSYLSLTAAGTVRSSFVDGRIGECRHEGFYITGFTDTDNIGDCFSISGWVLGNGVRLFAKKQLWAEDTWYVIWEGVGKIGVNGAYRGASATVPDFKSTWRRVDLVRDATGMYLYIDGEIAISNTSIAGMSIVNNYDIQVGMTDSWNNNECWDEFRIASGALDAKQIAAQYALESGVVTQTYTEPAQIIRGDKPVVTVTETERGINYVKFELFVATDGDEDEETVDIYVETKVAGGEWSDSVLMAGGVEVLGHRNVQLVGFAPSASVQYRFTAMRDETAGDLVEGMVQLKTPGGTNVPVDIPAGAEHFVSMTFGGSVTGVDGSVVVPVKIPATIAAACAADGSDLRFFDNSTNTELPFDVYTWDTAGESLVWVRLPAIRSLADGLTIFWGGEATALAESAVWQDYAGVWHLDEQNGATTFANVVPESPFSVTKTAAGWPTTLVDVGCEEALYGLCRKGEVVVTGFTMENDIGNNFTITGWTWGDDSVLLNKKLAYQQDTWYINRNGGTSLEFVVATGVTRSTIPSLTDGWHHVALVGDGVDVRLYIDGELQVSGSLFKKDVTNPYDLTFGRNDWNRTEYWDEVRVSRKASSAEQIAALYAAESQVDEAAFGTIGTIDTTLPDGPLVYLETPKILDDGTVSYTYRIDWPGKDKATCSALFVYGLEADSMPYVTDFGGNLIGTCSGMVTGLLPGRTYFAKVIVDNGDATAESEIRTFTIAETGAMPETFDAQTPVLAGLGEAYVSDDGETALFGGGFAHFVAGAEIVVHYSADGVNWLVADADVTAAGFTAEIGGLIPETAYDYYLTAHDGDYLDKTPVRSFTTKGAAKLSAQVTVTSNQRMLSAAGELTDAGAGEGATVRLWVRAADGDWTEAMRTTLTAPGKFTLDYDGSASLQFGTDYKAKLTVENASASGTYDWSAESFEKSVTPVDLLTYTWTGAAETAEKLWADPANWTPSSDVADRLGYPDCGGASAVFEGGNGYQVLIDRAISVASLVTPNDGSVKFVFSVPMTVLENPNAVRLTTTKAQDLKDIDISVSRQSPFYRQYQGKVPYAVRLVEWTANRIDLASVAVVGCPKSRITPRFTGTVEGKATTLDVDIARALGFAVILR